MFLYAKQDANLAWPHSCVGLKKVDKRKVFLKNPGKKIVLRSGRNGLRSKLDRLNLFKILSLTLSFSFQTGESLERSAAEKKEERKRRKERKRKKEAGKKERRKRRDKKKEERGGIKRKKREAG